MLPVEPFEHWLKTDIPGDILQRLTAAAEARVLEKGQPLLRPGEVCASQALVLAGCLRLYFDDEDGTQRILYFAPEGWWMTDIESLVSGDPSGFWIDAIERTHILLIGNAVIEQLRIEKPAFERAIRECREGMLLAMQRRLTTSLRKTAVRRYADFEHDYPGLADRIPQYQIAAYVGVTAEFMSTLRGRMNGKK
jgi:CRP/FNR family transcriptional regulator, anaerobic regulatory protein